LVSTISRRVGIGRLTKRRDFGVDMNPYVGKGFYNTIGCDDEGGLG
jgi:hypothetical protein